jgi:hypothetical protein
MEGRKIKLRIGARRPWEQAEEIGSHFSALHLSVLSFVFGQ